mmetsp:Transcript_15274/g.37942  ORF Transcript_15274/g.37942 Transcript_15274/m.37942 type:complete len:241 (+) Transcript_15274:687-1409(+)
MRPSSPSSSLLDNRARSACSASERTSAGPFKIAFTTRDALLFSEAAGLGFGGPLAALPAGDAPGEASGRARPTPDAPGEPSGRLAAGDARFLSSFSPVSTFAVTLAYFFASSNSMSLELHDHSSSESSPAVPLRSAVAGGTKFPMSIIKNGRFGSTPESASVPLRFFAFLPFAIIELLLLPAATATDTLTLLDAELLFVPLFPVGLLFFLFSFVREPLRDSPGALSLATFLLVPPPPLFG